MGSIFRKIDHKIIFLDNLLMSCRVIGRYYESWLLNEAIKQCKNLNTLLDSIPTQKNIVVKNFFQDHNFGYLKRL